MKSIYSRKHPGSALLGECEWCGRSIIRSDPFVVEEYNAGLSKRLIHHSPIHDCLEKYWEKQKEDKRKEKEEKEKEDKPNPLDEFWKHLGQQ